MADGRQKKKRETKGAYWMDTYGDMVTLLLTFFVMMFASSQMTESKWIRIVESFTGETPGSIVEPIDPLNPTSGFQPSDFIERVEPRDMPNEETGSGNTEDSQSFDASMAAVFNELYDKLVQYVDENGLAKQIVVERQGQFIYVTLMEGVLFDSGYADIRDEEAERILTDIGNMFMKAWTSVKTLRIEGHTDSVPINNGRFKDNRSLSAERANEVFRFLNEHTGVPNTSVVESVGMGETVPIASNETAEGKQQNRRVEFILESTASVVADEEAPGEGAEGGEAAAQGEQGAAEAAAQSEEGAAEAAGEGAVVDAEIDVFNEENT